MSSHTQQHALNSIDDHVAVTASQFNAMISDTNFVTSAGVGGTVTFENLNNNGDVGAAGDQVAPGNHLHGGTYEPAFSKNSAFNKNFGAVSNTVCQGNDSRLSDARTPVSHNNTYHSEAYITSGGVTYNNLSLNGAVGTSSNQVARGNHLHSGVYEPVFSKNTAFNKNFTASGGINGISTTVARGDHYHHDLTFGAGLSAAALYDGSVDRSVSVNFGAAAGTACQGNDARLSDARPPTSHTVHPGLQSTGGSFGGTQGAWVVWNSAAPGAGRTEFINHYGTGSPGGHHWYNTNNGTPNPTGYLNSGVFEVYGGGSTTALTNAASYGVVKNTGSMVVEAQSGQVILKASGVNEINMTSTYTAVNSLAAGGDVYASSGSGTLVISSDERLKEIHGFATYGVNEIMKLKPIIFNMKSDGAGAPPTIGFSAQNVLEAGIKEAVTGGNKTYKYYGLATRGILAALVNGFQDQELRIRALEGK